MNWMGSVRAGLPVIGAILCLPAPAQTTYRASVDGHGVQGIDASGLLDPAAFSQDGRFLAFRSAASNLVPNDTNGRQDVFVRDLLNGTTELVSLGSSGNQADQDCLTFSMSADARYVAFWSAARYLVPSDTNHATDVFVRDRVAGTTERASVNSLGREGNGGSYYASISADGSFVAFYSSASNLVAGDTNDSVDVFVRDRVAGTTERVNLSSSGAQSQGLLFDAPSISGDGRFVLFTSSASDLVPGDTNHRVDVFVRDRQYGTTERVSVGNNGAQGNNDSYAGAGPSISLDGRYVVFSSLSSNLVTGDSNGDWDVFLRDRLTGSTQLVSVGNSGVQADSMSSMPSMSSDARFIAFSSTATNLVGPPDTRGFEDIFVRDRLLGTTELASVDLNGIPADSHSGYPTISSDGRLVAFESEADDLVPLDTNGVKDVFIRDRGPTFDSYCSGDGTGSPCPCGNSGAAGHGCENSAGTGGASLLAQGVPRISADSLQLVSSGELSTSLSVFFQGRVAGSGASFGDGLRCLGTQVNRLHVGHASGGVAAYPVGGQWPISVVSAALGDAIQAGFTRCYQVVYRDGSTTFCPGPSGGTFNSSNGVSLVWGP